MLFFKGRVSKREPQWDTALIESIYRGLDESLVTDTLLRSAAVPDTRRKCSVNRGYFNTVTEILRILFQNLRKNEVELKMRSYARKMKSCDSKTRSTFFTALNP